MGIGNITDPNGVGISVGDAVLSFIGDTTDLERAWTDMETSSKASGQKAIDAVLKEYDRLGIEGTAKLQQMADAQAEAFDRLSSSGTASIGDLIQAEQSLLETQVALRNSMGQAIPPEYTARIESLKLQYIGLTGTVEEFEAAQLQSIEVLNAATLASDRDAAALLKQAAAAQVAADLQVSKGTITEPGAGGGLGGLAALGATATTLAMYAGIAAVAGTLAEGTKKALEFDAAFTELTTVIQEKTPHSAEVIQMLRDQLQALPPTLGNITELTHGVYQALSAGVPAAEAVQVVAKSAMLARAALTDQETTVKLVTAAMNAYGLTARDVDGITSELMATIQVGVLRGPQLADSLGRVLPVAANLKVSLADVLAAASALTSGGLSADEAMTALRQVLSAIEKPSSEAKKAMAALHGSFADIRQEIVEKGLGAGLADLGAKIKDNTTLTTELFGNIRALTGILGLTGAQAEKYKQNIADISQAQKEANLAQIEFNKINASMAGQLKTTGAAISNEFTKGFETLKPILEGFLPSLKSLLLDTGLLQVLCGTLVLALLAVSQLFNVTAIAVEGLKLGFLYLAEGVDIALRTVLRWGSANAAIKADLAEIQGWVKSTTDSIKDNNDAMHKSNQAFNEWAGLAKKGSDGSAEFAAAQQKLAAAQDKLTETQKRAADSASEAARVIQDEKDKHTALEEAVKKTTKAMEQYANAHGIPLLKELNDNVAAARKFANEMKESNQPIAAQVASIINLNIQLSKLKSMLADQRSIGDMIQGHQGKQPEMELEKLPEIMTTVVDQLTGIVSKVPLQVTDPLVDAFNTVVEAEKKLGITGTATLAHNVAEAAVALKVLEAEYAKGNVSAHDLQAGTLALAAANKKLEESWKVIPIAVQQGLDAEKAAGIEGTQVLTQRRNAAADNLVAIKAAAKAGVESQETVMQAELKLLLADRALKQQLGKPIPKAMDDSIRKLTASLAAYHKELSQAPTEMQTFQAVQEMGKQALDSFASGFGNAVQQFESGQKSLAAATKEAVQSAVESLSAQAAVQAVMMTANGIAAAAMMDYQAAGEYFAAAAEYAAVAVVAGAVGMAMGTSSSPQGGSSPGGGSTTAASQPTANPVQTVNVQRFGGGGLVTGRTLAMIGDSKHDSSKDATEAVLPLDDPQSMAKLRAGLGSGGGDTYHVAIEGVISSDTLDTVMDQMSSRVNKRKKLVASHANRVVKKS